MDLYLDYLNKRMAQLQKRGPDNPFETALLLREGMKYAPDTPALLTELALQMVAGGFVWESYRLAKKAYGLDHNGRAQQVISLVEEPPLPPEVTLEVSTVCNLRCPLCENGSGLMEYPRKFMPFETFRTVWDKLRPSTKRLVMVGSGETFLHPDIYRILDYVKGTPYIYIDTNGNVDLDCDKIIEAGINDFTFSVDGVNQQMYERYRRNGNLERVLRNFRALVEAKRRHKAARPTITFKFVVFKHTEMYLKEAHELARSLGAEQFRIEPCTFRPVFGPDLFRQFMPLSPDHQRIEYVDFERAEIGCPPARDSRHCGTPMTSTMVTVEGEVCPCCTGNHFVMFGDLTKQGWAEVWNSPAYARFRLRVAANRWSEPICRLCSREQQSPGRFFEGTEFADGPPPAPAQGAGRLYVKDNLVSMAEIDELLAQGHLKEALYFLSLGKAQVPQGWAPAQAAPGAARPEPVEAPPPSA